MRLQKEGQLGRQAGKLDRATESHKMGTGDVLVNPSVLEFNIHTHGITAITTECPALPFSFRACHLCNSFATFVLPSGCIQCTQLKSDCKCRCCCKSAVVLHLLKNIGTNKKMQCFCGYGLLGLLTQNKTTCSRIYWTV